MNTPTSYCPAGHEYTTDNTHINKLGYRICRECNRLRAVARREAAAAPPELTPEEQSAEAIKHHKMMVMVNYAFHKMGWLPPDVPVPAIEEVEALRKEAMDAALYGPLWINPHRKDEIWG